MHRSGTGNSGTLGTLRWPACVAMFVAAVAAAGCYRFPINRADAFVPATEANFIAADDLVLGVAIGSKAWAFPVPALAPIEVLNASIGDLPVDVTW